MVRESFKAWPHAQLRSLLQPLPPSFTPPARAPPSKVPSLFAPGPNPASNLEFLLALAATVRAVDSYSELMRWSIASAGNDWRLGGHEVLLPPLLLLRLLMLGMSYSHTHARSAPCTGTESYSNGPHSG